LVRVTPSDEAELHRVEDSYRRAYLKGKKSLKWMVGIIRSSSLRGSELRALLDRMDTQLHLDESAKTCAEELRKELKRLSFI